MGSDIETGAQRPAKEWMMWGKCNLTIRQYYNKGTDEGFCKADVPALILPWGSFSWGSSRRRRQRTQLEEWHHSHWTAYAGVRMHESPKKPREQSARRPGKCDEMGLEESFMLRNVCFFFVCEPQSHQMVTWSVRSDCFRGDICGDKNIQNDYFYSTALFFLISLGDWKGQINTIRRLNEIGLARLQNFWLFLIIS